MLCYNKCSGLLSKILFSIYFSAEVLNILFLFFNNRFVRLFYMINIENDYFFFSSLNQFEALSLNLNAITGVNPYNILYKIIHKDGLIITQVVVQVRVIDYDLKQNFFTLTIYFFFIIKILIINLI